MSAIISGLAASFFGLLGLAMASRAEDDGAELFGLALFLFGVLFVFEMIRRYEPAPTRETVPLTVHGQDRSPAAAEPSLAVCEPSRRLATARDTAPA